MKTISRMLACTLSRMMVLFLLLSALTFVRIVAQGPETMVKRAQIKSPSSSVPASASSSELGQLDLDHDPNDYSMYTKRVRVKPVKQMTLKECHEQIKQRRPKGHHAMTFKYRNCLKNLEKFQGLDLKPLVKQLNRILAGIPVPPLSRFDLNPSQEGVGSRGEMEKGAIQVVGSGGGSAWGQMKVSLDYNSIISMTKLKVREEDL